MTGRTEPSGFFQIAFTEVVDTGAFAIPNQQEHAMHHRIRSLALAVALAASGGVAAQDFAFGWNPRSGDVWVDTYLNDINDYGYRYREPFVDELVRYHDAPRDLVTELLIDRRWAPGDVYYACSIASVLGRPCRYVVDEWDRDHGQGWGALAQRLGIKPGSAEFHRLKKGFVPTYDRWARPIELDNDLVRVYPDRRRITIADRDLRIDADGRGNGNGKAKGNNKAGGNDKVKGNGKGNADKGKPAHAGKDKGKPDHAGGGKSGDKGKGKGES